MDWPRVSGIAASGLPVCANIGRLHASKNNRIEVKRRATVIPHLQGPLLAHSQSTPQSETASQEKRLNVRRILRRALRGATYAHVAESFDPGGSRECSRSKWHPRIDYPGHPG